jgi:alanine dehydrogenase
MSRPVPLIPHKRKSGHADNVATVLAPMSEVAGRLSIEAAETALKRYPGGRGLLIGGVPGVQPARIVVIGGGVVGTPTARMAAGLGAEVSILDRSIPRLRELDEMFEGRVRGDIRLSSGSRGLSGTVTDASSMPVRDRRMDNSCVTGA